MIGIRPSELTHAIARITINKRAIPREISRENSILIREVSMVAGSLFTAILIYNKIDLIPLNHSATYS